MFDKLFYINIAPILYRQASSTISVCSLEILYSFVSVSILLGLLMLSHAKSSNLFTVTCCGYCYLQRVVQNVAWSVTFYLVTNNE